MNPKSGEMVESDDFPRDHDQYWRLVDPTPVRRVFARISGGFGRESRRKWADLLPGQTFLLPCIWPSRVYINERVYIHDNFAVSTCLYLLLQHESGPNAAHRCVSARYGGITVIG